MTGDWHPTGIDTETPSTARMYDYYLGGKDHYPADREAAQQVLAAIPDLPTVLRENRRFLRRAVQVMAQAGIQQFLDLGAGLPTEENVHQVAQAATPDARVVYVDHDPVAVAHARALLATDAQTTVADADLRHPDQVLTHPEVIELIDFDEPLGVLFVAVLHFVTDEENPAGVVAAFRDVMASGSHLAISHGTRDHLPTDTDAAPVQQTYEQATSTITSRSQEQIRGLFAGFDVLEPGIVPLHQWRTDPVDPAATLPTLGFAGLGRKP